MKHTHLLLLCLAAMLFLSVGYAALTDNLTITGSVEITASSYDIYIESVTPDSNGGITVRNIAGTVLFAETINVSGKATFTVKIVNDKDSGKTYVFERVIDGKESGFDGVYQGDDITYSYSVALKPMRTELAPGESVTFTLTIDNSKGIQTSNYVLDFHFIEQTGMEILPTTTAKPEDPTDPTETTTAKPAETTKPGETTTAETEKPPEPEETTQAVGDGNFLGVVEILLSEAENCLNDPGKKGDVIPEAMIDILDSNNYSPPYILHCGVNSISGGTMSNITATANANTTKEVYYILVGEKGDYKHFDLYLYYRTDCENGSEGTEILVYRQLLTYTGDHTTDKKDHIWSGGKWEGTGSYEGRAQIAILDSGGNLGNYKMIDPTTWKAGAPTTASEP